MPMTYDGCVKVHENCGGVIGWREKLDDPSVGFVGDCRLCQEDSIVVERMIPVKAYTFREVSRVKREVLADLEWNHDEDFETNQERLESELKRYV